MDRLNVAVTAVFLERDGVGLQLVEQAPNGVRHGTANRERGVCPPLGGDTTPLAATGVSRCVRTHPQAH